MKATGLQFPPKHDSVFFSGQTHEIRGRFRCVNLEPVKRFDVMFLNKMRVLEEWTILANDSGELVPDISTSYQAIVNNDPSVIDWFKQAKPGDIIENEYDVELLWNICGFEGNRIICFVKERWKVYDLNSYYITLECPSINPVWL